MIRQELAGLVSSQTALMEGAQKETRSLNESETTSFNDLQVKILERKAALAVAETHEENQRSFGPAGNGEPVVLVPGTEKRELSFSLNKAIRALVSGTALEGAELVAHKRASAAATAAGIGVNPNGLMVPLFSENRAEGQTVTQDGGAFGGTTVATDTMAPIDFLRPKPILESLGAIFLTGLQGNVSFPKNKGGITAYWKGEVITADASKDEFAEIEMTPKRLTVRVPISLQNLMQSSFDMEAYTAKTIRDEIANAIDKAGINGSGIGDPRGILNYPGINTLSNGDNGNEPTWPSIVALETPVFVANANAARMGYLSNPKLRGKLKVTPQQVGQATYLMAESGSVNGYDFAVSNHVPSNLTKGTSTAVCSAAIFGDFSQLVIGQWGFMDLTVDNLSRKKDGYIEIIANVFVDIAIMQEGAFTAAKDYLTT